MKKDRVYIFVDKSLNNPQKVVQSTHLGIESQKQYPSENHPSVIVLAISLDQINYIKETLIKRSIKFVDFYEPLFDKVTGIATEPISKDIGKYLQHFPTIKEKDFMSNNLLLTAKNNKEN